MALLTFLDPGERRLAFKIVMDFSHDFLNDQRDR